MKTSIIKMLILAIFASFISLGIGAVDSYAQQKDKPKFKQEQLRERKSDSKPKKKHKKHKHKHRKHNKNKPHVKRGRL